MLLHGASAVDCGHEVSGQWFGSHCQIDTQLIFHTGIQHSTRYTYTPLPLDEDLDKKYVVPFVMRLVGAALLVHSLNVARSHASSSRGRWIIQKQWSTMAGIGHDKRCSCSKNRLSILHWCSKCMSSSNSKETGADQFDPDDHSDDEWRVERVIFKFRIEKPWHLC